MSTRTMLLYCGFISLSLLVLRTSGQTCASEVNSYAEDFPTGTVDRWLYNNIAKGAECVSISRTQDIDARCIEWVYNVPDVRWPQYEGHFLRGEDDLILNRRNYSQFWTAATFTKDVCINACRVRPWCKSADWSYGYDKCRLSMSHGTPEPQVDENYLTYVEKPVCNITDLPRTNSLSYFRLGLKLFASRKYDMALDKMTAALQADSYHKINYWAVALTTLINGGFNAQSITDAREMMSRLEVKEFPETSSVETNIIKALTDALTIGGDDNMAHTLAFSYESLYTEVNVNRDLLAGTIAAIAYKHANNMDKFRTILVDILVQDPDYIAALYLYLHEYATDGMMIFSHDEGNRTQTLDYTSRLLIADPRNPYALTQALYVYYYYEMYAMAVDIATDGLNLLPAVLNNGFFTEDVVLFLRTVMFDFSHNSHLFRNDITRAEVVETEVETFAMDTSLEVDTKAKYAALLYRMKSRRYFEFVFSETPDNMQSLPASAGSVTQIDTSDAFFTVARISQYMYRQAVVTQQLRTGSDADFNSLVQNWERIKELSKYDSMYDNIVDYNLNLLHAENVMRLQGNQELLFGEDGFLNVAAGLRRQISSDDYLVMSLERIMAYATFKSTRNLPSPLGRSTNGINVPRNLAWLYEDLMGAWPRYSPNKINAAAGIKLATGDKNDSLAILRDAQSRLVNADIRWFSKALDRVTKADNPVLLSELLPSELSVPLPANQDIVGGLDVDWTWSAPVSAMEPCTAMRYRNLDNVDYEWRRQSQKSFISSEMTSYFSTNAYSCKQRCLFEKQFACKAFTFGFNRCLLHNQRRSDVPSNERLDDLSNEEYYDISRPACTPDSNNAYSSLVSGVKAMSNRLRNVGLQHIQDAMLLDPLMSMPKILRALGWFMVDCETANAVNLLKEPMQMTNYESLMASAINNTIHGQLQDARNYFQDLAAEYPGDEFTQFLRNLITGEIPTDPVISGDYIARITSDVMNSDEDISRLEDLSPASPRPALFNAFKLYRRGQWRTLISEIDSLLLVDDNYVGFSDDASTRHLAIQLKHFAMMQLGQYMKAENLYNEHRLKEELAAVMYTTQIYTQLIHFERSPVVALPALPASTEMCSPALYIIGSTMEAISIYTNPNIDSSRRNSARTALNATLHPLRPIGLRDVWKDVSEVFYRLTSGDGSGAAEKVNTASDDSKAFLAASVDLASLGLDLIVPQELVVWSTLNQATALKSSDYARLAELLNQVMESRPNRAVTLWLKYKLYRDWRNIDSTKRNESISAADTLLTQWTDSDGGSLYDALSFYSKYPDPTDDENVAFAGSLEPRLPSWAIWMIIALSAAILLACVISCIIWLCGRNSDNKPKKEVYSGSIYSTSTGGHNDSVVPEEGGVMYATGQRNEG